MVAFNPYIQKVGGKRSILVERSVFRDSPDTLTQAVDGAHHRIEILHRDKSRVEHPGAGIAIYGFIANFSDGYAIVSWFDERFSAMGERWRPRIVRNRAGHCWDEYIPALRLAIFGQLFTNRKAGNIVVADVPHQVIILKNGKLAREICMVVGVIGEHGPIRVPKAPIFLEKYHFST